MRPRGAPGRRWQRSARRASLGLVALLVGLAAAGATYNALWVRYYRKTFPPPGKLYAVNGKQMHLHCAGEGVPALVLEAGLGGDSMSWDQVQPALSKTTRVCSYDRIGVGWSDPQAGESDSTGVADRLHALLLEAGIGDPVVLMGHSIAGLYMRVYAARFPKEVAGLVFVDTTTPGWIMNASPEQVASNELAQREVRIAKWRAALGISRLMAECSQAPPWIDDADAGWFKANGCVPSHFDALLAESAAVLRSAEEAAATGPFGDLPMLIFSSDVTRVEPNTPLARMAPGWNAEQEGLKALSTRSRRIIARGSGHNIQISRPDLLNREVPVFIQQVRSNVTSAENGTTETW